MDRTPHHHRQRLGVCARRVASLEPGFSISGRVTGLDVLEDDRDGAWWGRVCLRDEWTGQHASVLVVVPTLREQIARLRPRIGDQLSIGVASRDDGTGVKRYWVGRSRPRLAAVLDAVAAR